MSELKKNLAAMIGATFPEVEFAFGYGSGVFPQKDRDAHVLKNVKSSAPMVDMVFAVNDPETWHLENLKMNPKHYAVLPRVLGAGAVTTVQNLSAGLYYNTLVPVPIRYRLGEGQLMKYGVVSKETILSDLKSWNTLYCSGRLQKPVSILKTCDSLVEPLEANLQAALAASLLILPPTFSEFELYMQITSLSYEGDFRMGIAENPNKIENIVRGNNSLPRFKSLYRPYLDSLIHDQILKLDADDNNIRSFQRTENSEAIEALQKWLPLTLRNRIDSSQLLGKSSGRSVIKNHLHEIISSYSRTQTAKGIFTAGVAKSAIYSFQKILKRVK